MKKKTISIILILTMLLLPFSALLNVKAVNITVDNNTTNGQGKKVTNQVSAGATVKNIGENDTLAMYKLLDVYYDSATNQMSYGFTSSFGTFASAQSPQLSVNGYLGTSTTNSNGGEYDDNSAFNALISSYAQYVRANSVSATYSMTTSHVTDNEGDYYAATKTNAEAGVYLILPSSSSPFSETGEGLENKVLVTYSVLIANLVPSVDQNGDWTFTGVELYAKAENSMTMGVLLDGDLTEFADFINDQAVLNPSQSTNYNANKDYSYLVYNQSVILPENPHSSIAALATNNTLNMIDFIYPAAITPDVTSVAYFTGEGMWDARISNGKYYVTDDESTPVEHEFANITTSTGKMLFDYSDDFDSFFSIIFDLNITADSLSNAAGGNTITTYTYSVKDPYVDIGSNVTKSDIRAAFDTSDANYSSSKSVNIRKAIDRVEQTVTLNATGVTVNNTNSSNVNLNGGEFAVYSTYNNGTYSNQVGSNIVMSNGTGLLNGLDPTETYYLKQVKAPTGYTLYDDKVIVLKGTNDSTNYDSNNYTVVTASNGMYTTTVVNNPVLALPFTGGTGTMLYTCIGLFVIIGSAIFMVMYKKRNKKEVVEEL